MYFEKMELSLGFQLLTLLAATLTVSVAQQQPQPAPQSVLLPQQGRSAPLLGVRYSAATDVSHISFNSPLVTYGSSLNEIRLPAAPIQPANLKQAPQAEQAASDENEGAPQQAQTLVRSFGNQAQTQQLQSQTTANQPQFISVQQYPANPQLQSPPQGFTLSQNLPGPQPQPQSAPRYAQQFPQQPQQYAAAQPQYALPEPQTQPQYVLPQPQQYLASQQQYVAPQQQYVPPQQQYVEPQQQYLTPQQPQLQYPTPVAYSSPANNAYFATGPYAAQYPQPSFVNRQQQVVQQGPVVPQYPQPLAPTAQLVSRVAFNGPTTGFSYSF